MSVVTDRRISRGLSLLGDTITSNIEDNKDHVELPAFIIYYILSHLRRTEVYYCASVSKLWKTVTSDACFGWLPAKVVFMRGSNITTHDVQEHEDAFEVAIKYGKPETDLVSTNIQQEGPYKKPRFEIKTKNKTHVGYLSDNLESMRKICEQHPSLWRWELLKPDIPESKRGNYSLRSDTLYFFLFEINVRELEKRVEKSELIPMSNYIEEAVVRENRNEVEKYIFGIKHKNAHIPLKTLATQKQPMGLVKSLKLYKYQLDAVAWLKSVEEDVDTDSGFEYSNLMPWRAGRTPLLFTPAGVPVKKSDIPSHKHRVFPRGGILADEMGSFFVLIALHILAHPGDPSQLNLKNEEEYKTNATLVVCPEHLVKQWHCEIEKHTRPILSVVEVNNLREFNSVRYSDIVAADVVLVSEELLLNNNYRDLRPKGKYASFSDQHRKVKKIFKLENFSWRRIVVDEAHQVNISYQREFANWRTNYVWYVSGTPFPSEHEVWALINFLRFPRIDYVANGENAAQKAAFIDIYTNNLYWRNTKESVKNEYTIPPLVNDLILLNFTPLESIIYNYYHAESNSVGRRMINYIPLNTAFHMNSTLAQIKIAIIKFFEKSITSEESEMKEDEEEVRKVKEQKLDKEEELKMQVKNQADHTVIRDLELSIASCAQRISTLSDYIRDIETRIKQLSPILKLLMETSNYNGTNMDSELTMPEAVYSESLKGDNLKQEEKEKSETEDKDEIPEEEAALPFSENKIVDMNLVELKKALKVRGVTIGSNKRKADLQNLLKKAVKDNVKPLDIKQGEKRKASSSAEKPKKKAKAASPSADTPTKLTMADKMKEHKLLQWLVEKDGTKLANLTLYLKHVWTENPAAKFIIFSQHELLLNKISSILTERNVNHATRDGNIQNKVKQIREFKNNADIRVLLLNIKSVASGTNLIEATHIIFMEPYNASVREAIAYEDQAIARAHRQGQTGQVTVTRFIVRDTSEYAAYVQCYGGAEISETIGGTQSGYAKLQKSNSLVNSLTSASVSEAIRLLEDETETK